MATILHTLRGLVSSQNTRRCCAPRKTRVCVAADNYGAGDGSLAVYSDASVRMQRAGIGAVWMADPASAIVLAVPIVEHADPHRAELAGMFVSLLLAPRHVPVVLHTDSRAGMLSLCRPNLRRTNVLAQSICCLLDAHPHPASVIHVRGHSGVLGNEIADRMAWKASAPSLKHHMLLPDQLMHLVSALGVLPHNVLRVSMALSALSMLAAAPRMAYGSELVRGIKVVPHVLSTIEQPNMNNLQAIAGVISSISRHLNQLDQSLSGLSERVAGLEAQQAASPAPASDSDSEVDAAADLENKIKALVNTQFGELLGSLAPLPGLESQLGDLSQVVLSDPSLSLTSSSSAPPATGDDFKITPAPARKKTSSKKTKSASSSPPSEPAA